MFDTCKYIVVRDSQIMKENIFTFHPTITHSSMYKAMRELGYDEIVSAGFVGEFMECYGSSTSLRASSRPEKDTEMLHRLFQIDDKEIKFKEEE